MNSWMIDFDGVIADLSGAMIASCNAKFGTTYAPGDEVDWNWWRRQPSQYANYVWKECYPDPRWLLECVQPYDGVLEALADLMTDPRIADAVNIVTARPSEQHPWLMRWIEQQGIPILSHIEIHCVGRDSKAAHCGGRIDPRPNIIVEDGIHNLREFHPDLCRLYIIDRPWNRHEVVNGAYRVPGLADVIEYEALEVAV